MTNTDRVDALLAKRLERQHLRERMVELSARGATVRVIAEAFKVPMRKVYRDLALMRKKAGNDFKNLNQLETIGACVKRYVQVLDQSYQQYAQAQQPAMRQRWLALVLATQDKLDNFLSRVGAIPTMRQQIEISGKLDVEWYGDQHTSAAELMSELRGVGSLTN